MKDAYPRATAHGAITPLTDGVHYVRGTFKIGMGLVISRTMTIIVASDGLVLVNSVRLDAAGLAALARLGRVAHVVNLSDAHGLDDAFYVETFGAAYWTMPGARPKRLKVDRVLGRVEGADSPLVGARVIVLADGRAARRGDASGCEGALWLPNGGGTLITCDAIQNHCDYEGTTWLTRRITPLLGFRGGVIVPKMWRRVHEVGPELMASTFDAINAHTFANFVAAHGPPVIGGADVVVRAATVAKL